MELSLDGGETPAPRKEADSGAIEAAYERGLVNRGDIQIPMIDWRNYLEDELDMHNSHQSFATRQRLIDFDGDASNQVIWFTDQPLSMNEPLFDQTPMAFAVIDEWMRNIARYPWKSIHENKPVAATDSCFDAAGELIYAGDDAWDGILNDKAYGPCSQEMPVYQTSRIVAGAPITGDIFMCYLMPVADAIDEGVYGEVVFNAAQLTRLEQIFPRGVCDYSEGDARRP
jgi:hypothetical protein